MLKILIADDHAIVRKGLREILRDASETTTVGEASDGREALERARAEPWDMVVLDITMPDLSGLAVLKGLKRDKPDLPVVILSVHADYHYVVGSLRAGASGYLSKETAPEELVLAVETVLAGGRYVSRALAEKLKIDV